MMVETVCVLKISDSFDNIEDTTYVRNDEIRHSRIEDRKQKVYVEVDAVLFQLHSSS